MFHQHHRRDRAPNITDIHHRPPDPHPDSIRREFGLKQGNTFRANISLEQHLILRPVAGGLTTARPSDNLICAAGSATTPDGGIRRQRPHRQPGYLKRMGRAFFRARMRPGKRRPTDHAHRTARGSSSAAGTTHSSRFLFATGGFQSPVSTPETGRGGAHHRGISSTGLPRVQLSSTPSVRCGADVARDASR